MRSGDDDNKDNVTKSYPWRPGSERSLFPFAFRGFWFLSRWFLDIFALWIIVLGVVKG
jgi:hypothetical protein